MFRTLFTLVGLGLVIGLIIAVALGLFTDLPPAVVGPIIGVAASLATGLLLPRL